MNLSAEEGSATVRPSCSLGRVRCSSGVSGKAALSITRRPGASDRRAGWGAESCYSLERLNSKQALRAFPRNQAAISDWSNRCWLSRIRERASCLATSGKWGQTLVDAGCDADLPGAPPWLPPGSSPHPSWWAYSPPATCLRWVRRCGRGARSAPCSWPPRMPMAGAPTDLVVDAPPWTPCACSPLQPTRSCVRPVEVVISTWR